MAGRRLRWLWILAAVIVAVFILYVAVYTAGLSTFRKRVNANVAAQLGVAEVFHLTGSLNPFGLALTTRAPLNFTNGTAESAHIAVPLFTPWHIVSRLENLKIETQGIDGKAGWKLTTSQVAAQLVLSPDDISYQAVLSDLQIGGTDTPVEQTLRAPKLTIAYDRRLGIHNQSQPEETTTFEAAPLILPQRAAPREDIPAQLDNLSWRLTAEPALPPVFGANTDTETRRMQLAAWQMQGGTITVSPLSIDAFGLNMSLAGTIQLDINLALAGKMTLNLSGLAEAYDALGAYNARYHMMADDQFKNMGVLLRMLPKNADKSFSFPIGLRNHWITLLGVPLYRYGALSWETVPDEAPTEAAPLPETPEKPAISLPVNPVK